MKEFQKGDDLVRSTHEEYNFHSHILDKQEGHYVGTRESQEEEDAVVKKRDYQDMDSG